MSVAFGCLVTALTVFKEHHLPLLTFHVVSFDSKRLGENISNMLMFIERLRLPCLTYHTIRPPEASSRVTTDPTILLPAQNDGRHH